MAPDGKRERAADRCGVSGNVPPVFRARAQARNRRVRTADAILMTECPKCEGSTWVVVERNGVTGAERCECFDVRRNTARQARADIPPNYADATFESFSIPRDNPVAQ